MYATDINGRSLTLGVSGMLWENSLVMVDRETGSLWSHLLGECMRGSLTGTRLEVIPSVITTWGYWKSRHPDTTVVIMPRSTGAYVRSAMDINSGLLIGLHDEQQSKSWMLDSLKPQQVKNDRFGDIPVAVFLDADSLTAVIYDRRLGDQVLTFRQDNGLIQDVETGSQWDLLSGEAREGPLEGRRLTRMPGIVSDSAAWSIYHPLEDMSSLTETSP